MADVGFKIEGLEEVQKLLAELPDALDSRVQFEVHKAAAQIARKDLKEAAPSGKGKGKGKIKNSFIIKKSGTESGVLVGPKAEAYPIIFLEKGTKVRKTKSTTANRGKIDKRPFVANTHQKSLPKILEFVSQNYLSIIDKTITKMLKNTKKI
jgi:HK97 gp10 family phage protein